MPYIFNPFTNNLDATSTTVVPPGTVATLTGNSGGAVSPSGGNINVVGDGITISVAGNPGTSTLTISGTSVPFPWTTVSTNTTLVPNHGYIANGSSLDLTMPVLANVGDTIKISNPVSFSGSFIVSQPSNVVMELGDIVTSFGVPGSIASTQSGSFIVLVCTVSADGSFLWSAESSVGNFILT